MMRYWKRIDTEGKTTTVEKYSHDLKVEGAIEITETEFDDYIASVPKPPEPEPPRDLSAEIDDHEVRLKNLEKE